MTGNVGSQPLCQHTNSTVFPQEGHWSRYDRCCLCLCSYCSLQRNSLRWDAAGGPIHLITYSSNRELRKGLSWLKGQLRNVFWLLIDCEWVINWAVIIRPLSKAFVHPWHLCQTARAGLKLGLCALLSFPVYFLSGQQQIWSGILKCYCTTNSGIRVSWAVIASYLSVLTFSILLKRTGCFVVHLMHKMTE